MRKTLFPLLVALLCLGGCKKQAGPMQVAEEYYGMLVRGDVDSYLCGMADYESMPDDYRSPEAGACGRSCPARHADWERPGSRVPGGDVCRQHA